MTKVYSLSEQEQSVLTLIRKTATDYSGDKPEYNLHLITVKSLKRSGFRKKQIRTFQHIHWHQANLSPDDKAIIECTKKLLPKLLANKSKKQGGKNKRRIQKVSKHHPITADIGNNEYPRTSSDELETLVTAEQQQVDNVVDLPTVTGDVKDEKIAVNQ